MCGLSSCVYSWSSQKTCLQGLSHTPRASWALKSAFWHCLRHPGRYGAKGLWVYLLPLFLGDSGWGGITNSGENGLCQPWSSEVPGEFCCLFYEEEILQHLFLSDSHKIIFPSSSTLLSLVYIWELYTACKDMILKLLWLCRSWFINTFWRKTFIWIGSWIQIPWWQGCTVLAISIHSEGFFTSHLKLMFSLSCILFPRNLLS